MATVLIVDDDPDARLILDRVLRHAGHTTHVATNGTEAIEVWKQVRPMVGLIDIFMPEMDGIDAITELRSQFPDARIIAMSASWDAPPSLPADPESFDVLRIAREVGADRVLPKPLDPDAVCREVEAVLADGTRWIATSHARESACRIDPAGQVGFTMPVSDTERAWISRQSTPELFRLADQLMARLPTSAGAARVQRHNRLETVLAEIERRRRA